MTKSIIYDEKVEKYKRQSSDYHKMEEVPSGSQDLTVKSYHFYHRHIHDYHSRIRTNPSPKNEYPNNNCNKNMNCCNKHDKENDTRKRVNIYNKISNFRYQQSNLRRNFTVPLWLVIILSLILVLSDLPARGNAIRRSARGPKWW